MGRRKKTEEKFGMTAEVNPEAQVNLKAESEYLEIVRFQAKQKNNLLGVFDEKGEYKIQDERTLISLREISKKFEEKNENVVYASAKLGTFTLNFKIEFEIDETFCKSTLSFVEVESRPEESVKHLTVLAQDEQIFTPLYQQEMLKQWNVHSDGESAAKDDYLFETLRKQEEEYRFNLELSDLLSQLFLVKIQKLLESIAPLGNELLVDYRLLVEKQAEKDPSLLSDNIRLKQILDEILMRKKYKELLKNQELLRILESYSKPINNLRGKTTTLTEVAEKPAPAKQPEKKKETAPAKKKKSGGGKPKAKGGGGDKKKDDKPKKKDDKKESKGPPIYVFIGTLKGYEKKAEPPKVRREIKEPSPESVVKKPEPVTPVDTNAVGLFSDGSEISILGEAAEKETVIKESPEGNEKNSVRGKSVIPEGKSTEEKSFEDEISVREY